MIELNIRPDGSKFEMKVAFAGSAREIEVEAVAIINSFLSKFAENSSADYADELAFTLSESLKEQIYRSDIVKKHLKEHEDKPDESYSDTYQ